MVRGCLSLRLCIIPRARWENRECARVILGVSWSEGNRRLFGKAGIVGFCLG